MDFDLWIETEHVDGPIDDFCNVLVALQTGEAYALNVWTFAGRPDASAGETKSRATTQSWSDGRPVAALPIAMTAGEPLGSNPTCPTMPFSDSATQAPRA